MDRPAVSASQRRRLARLLFGTSPWGATTAGDDFEGFPLREVFDMRRLPGRLPLTRRTVRGKDLSRADARDAWIDRVDFVGCTFAEADFRGAHFKRCRFTDCGFRRARFDGATFSYSTEFVACRFEDCRFTGRFRIWQSRFRETAFAGCRLSNVDFVQSSFEDCSFSGRLRAVQFCGPDLPRASGLASGAPHVLRADFREAELDDIHFRFGVDATHCRWPPTHRLVRDIGSLLDALAAQAGPEAGRHLAELRELFAPDAQPQVLLSRKELEHLAPELADGLWELVEQQPPSG